MAAGQGLMNHDSHESPTLGDESMRKLESPYLPYVRIVAAVKLKEA